MSVEIKIPALGESITEAVIGKLLKKVGDTVAADEPIAVLETDKVTIDLQAPAAGVIDALAVSEGAKVRIGDTVGSVAAGSGSAKSAPAPQAPTAAAPPTSPARAASEPAKPAPGAPKETVASPGPSPTPVARAMAMEKGIDPNGIQGSGIQGRVMKTDVASASSNHRESGAPPALTLVRGDNEREERVAMTPLRRRVAERLLQAQSTAAILTTFNEIDMSAVMGLRKQYQDRFEKKHGIRLGFMGFFVRACVEALRNYPAVNASIDGQDVIFHHYYDIGVAVSGTRGLVVPVIRDADRKSFAELEATIADFGGRARNDKLTLADLQGGTFTISNGGIFGSLLSTPILNPPQTGILGMHSIQERPVVRDGQIVVRPMMYVALSYDHRLIDGREAVQFLVRVKEFIEDPERILLDV